MISEARLRALFILSYTTPGDGIPEELNHLARRIAMRLLDGDSGTSLARGDKVEYRKRVPLWIMQVAAEFLTVVGGCTTEHDARAVLWHAKFISAMGVEFVLNRKWRRGDRYRAEIERGEGQPWQYRSYHTIIRPRRSQRSQFRPDLMTA
jgi:hypothetical protein